MLAATPAAKEFDGHSAGEERGRGRYVRAARSARPHSQRADDGRAYNASNAFLVIVKMFGRSTDDGSAGSAAPIGQRNQRAGGTFLGALPLYLVRLSLSAKFSPTCEKARTESLGFWNERIMTRRR